jgi:hypothetical protein
VGTPTLYNQFKLKQHNGAPIDLDTDAIKVMVVTSAYTPNQAHAFKSDLTNEVSGTNYSARGTAISGVTCALSGGTVQWVHNDITWLQNAAGFANGRTFIWYQDTGVDATSKLIMYMTEAADVGNVNGDLILDGSAVTGVLNFT